MEWTFGIITTQAGVHNLREQLASIQSLGLDSYEVIVVGGDPISADRVRHIPFDESARPSWITRKKNMIAAEARFEHLAIAHDYFKFDLDWAAGFEIFGSDWNIAMNRVQDISGRRFYDWVYWDSPSLPRYSQVPYDVANQTSFQFIPGGYFVVKTDFMLSNPLDEDLIWGESEDVEWSLRVRDSGYKFNPFSRVSHLKKHRGYKFWRAIYPPTLQLRPRPDSNNWSRI